MSLANSQDTVFHDVPVIDLTDLHNRDPTTRKALVESVKNACINVGFFYVKNHGIPESVIENAVAASKEFFALPLETKLEIENKLSPVFKGYSPLLSGKNDPESRGDLQEGFEFGWEPIDSTDAPFATTDGEMHGANVWPLRAPQFRGAALQYYHAAVGLGKAMFPLFAQALDLREDFFDDKTRSSAALMRILHYPPQTGPVDDRIIGIGAHTDWECFTILYQQPEISALQVLNTKKEWIQAPPIPGTLVINLGDQFARWTNDIFKSTIHRAINRSGVERYSIPLFFGTDYDVLLEPISTCVSADKPAKYEAVTAGEYVKERLKATYGH